MIALAPLAGRVVTVARALVGAQSWDTAAALVAQPLVAPPHLSPAAARLLAETFAQGLPLALARRGGWMRRRWLGPDGAPDLPQRAWERPGPALELTAGTSRWLLALAAGRAGAEPPTIGTPSPGDSFALYLLAEGLPALARHAPEIRWPARLCAGNALAWLGHPDELSATTHTGPDAAQYQPWMEPPAARIVEALSGDLARRWVAIERAKATIAAPARMVALGAAQARVLGAWLDACDAAGRRDLAAFVTEAAARLLEHPRPTSAWTAALDRTGALTARQAANQAAGAFLRAVGRLDAWDADHRRIRHMDDGYPAAQMLLRDHEALGPARTRHAADVLASLDITVVGAGA